MEQSWAWRSSYSGWRETSRTFLSELPAWRLSGALCVA